MAKMKILTGLLAIGLVLSYGSSASPPVKQDQTEITYVKHIYRSTVAVYALHYEAMVPGTVKVEKEKVNAVHYRADQLYPKQVKAASYEKSRVNRYLTRHVLKPEIIPRIARA